MCCFFFSSRRRHTRSLCDWSSDVCSSDLWLHFQQAPAVPDIVGLELVRHCRAWPDHRHLASEYIEQLWKFVETALPEEAADTRQARIVGQLVNGFAVRC